MSVRAHPIVAAILTRFGGDIVDVRLSRAELNDGFAVPLAGLRQFSLGDIRQTLLDEADRVTAAQEALVRMGDRAAPDGGALLRAAHMEAAARLIDRCKADPDIMERLKKGARS